MMEKLNLPAFEFKMKDELGKLSLLDFIRRKWVMLTPEEWVRQNFIRFLVEYRQYPAALIGVEVPVDVNGLKQRADIIVYDRNASPVMIVECKATTVKLTNQVFEQAARYNLQHRVPYLIVTNGMQHIGARINHVNGSYAWLPNVPLFNELV